MTQDIYGRHGEDMNNILRQAELQGQELEPLAANGYYRQEMKEDEIGNLAIANKIYLNRHVQYLLNPEGHDMDINTVFPSNYLKAADLQKRKHKLTIFKCVMEKVGDEEKPIVYFVGKEKGLVLNKTNASVISSMFGPDTDNWKDCQVILYPTKVPFQGKPTDAIRIEEPFDEPAVGDDEDIPF